MLWKIHGTLHLCHFLSRLLSQQTNWNNTSQNGRSIKKLYKAALLKIIKPIICRQKCRPAMLNSCKASIFVSQVILEEASDYGKDL